MKNMAIGVASNKQRYRMAGNINGQNHQRVGGGALKSLIEK